MHERGAYWLVFHFTGRAFPQKDPAQSQLSPQLALIDMVDTHTIFEGEELLAGHREC